MTRLSARRRETSTNVGHERWLVSYSDFITLLFAFFVVMYSISQVNESKYRSLTETLNAAFADQPLPENLDGSAQDDLADIESLSQKIESELKGFPVQGQVRLGANENWIELTLSSEMLFGSGSADPSAEAKDVFSQLATLLEPYKNEIQIVGHTDNVPISNARFANNWALSSARAVAIVDYLSFQGVNPDQMSAVAFGEYRPVADNQTAEGRSLNRRVVVRISDQAVDAAQQAPENLFTPSNAATENQNPDEARSDVDTTQVQLDTPALENVNRRDGAIQPVRLKGGDLLFTSDPNLPRLREVEQSEPEE